METRRGHDRILVRGIEGEIGIGDVNNLGQTVKEQHCDEGWLVTSRRISSAAKEASDCQDNKHLYCYTFDELIDEKVDLTPYFEWLEKEVKNKQIDHTYVPLGCIKEEIDLVSQTVIGKSTYREDDGWINGYIDRWLCDRSKEHISILGEFGTGKTWFTLHFAWTELQKYLDAKKRGIERPRLPIVIPLRDYAKALDVGNVIAGFFFSKHNIRLTRAVFDQLNRMGKILLIFDGFDEMADKVDRQKMINNFWELARVVTPGSKAILTCRTEHFPEAKQGRSLLNAELQASTAALTGEPPQFEVLELEKFDEAQIRQVLLFKTSEETVNKIMANSQLLDLASRPVMIDLIIEALPEIEAGKPIDISRVYLYAICRKMERDIKSERTFTSLADKLYFMCELSWEMLSTDTMSLNYKLFPDRIRRLFSSAVQNETDLDHWHYDMMGQTMLIRNADGDYTPAHRSLLEFFVAYKFAAELGILADDFLDIARQQVNIDWSLPPQDYTWSEYFKRECDEQGNIKLIAPLKEFTAEKPDLLMETVGNETILLEDIKENFEIYSIYSFDNKSEIQNAVFELMKSMVNQIEAIDKLLNIATRATNVDNNNVPILGGNLINFLVYLNSKSLRGRKLDHIKAWYSCFVDTNISNCIFNNSDFSKSFFNKRTIARKAQFINTSLADIHLLLEDRLYNSIYRIDGKEIFKNKINYDDCYLVTTNNGNRLLPYENILKVTRFQALVVLCNSSIFQQKELEIYWQLKIDSPRLLNSELDRKNNVLHLLTLEGKTIDINIQTGKIIPVQNKDYFMNWKDADFEGATGLDAKTAYFLRLLGAINVPKIADEYNPYQDPQIIPSLRKE